MVRLPPVERGIGYLEIQGVADCKTFHLLKEANRSKPLHDFESIGFVDQSGAHGFRIVSRLPRWSSDSVQLVTLHQRLSRDQPSPLPSLEKRYELAAVLAKWKLFEAKEGQNNERLRSSHLEAID